MTTVEDADRARRTRRSSGASSTARAPRRASWSWFTTVDHKKIAIMYGTTAMFFFLVGGIEALLIRLQLAQPNGTILSAARYNEFFTMHGTTMVFLMGMPLAAAFGNYFLPLMIGARDVAFPRLNMFGYWVFLLRRRCSSTRRSCSAARPTAVGSATRRSRARRCRRASCPVRGADFWAVGLIMLGIGSVATAVNFIVTALNMRAPGMTMMKMPVFVWMMLVVAFLTLFAMPPLTAALIQVFMDRNFHTNFFNAAAGGDPLLYQNLFWIFGHPEVYILILPGMAIVSEILPGVLAQAAVRLLGRGVLRHRDRLPRLGRVGAPHVRDGHRPGRDLGVRAVDDAHRDPDRREDLQLAGHGVGRVGAAATPMLFALGFIAQFTIGGLSGVLHSIVPADTQQTDTYFVVAHFHYVLFGGLVFAIFGGIYYWYPKIFGKMLNEKLGKLNFWLMVDRLQPHVLPDALPRPGGRAAPHLHVPERHGLGHAQPDGDDRRVHHRAGGARVPRERHLHARSAASCAPEDPWDARTLEWMTSSPPPEYNFAEIPIVDAPRRVLAPQVHRGRRGPAREAAAERRGGDPAAA